MCPPCGEKEQHLDKDDVTSSHCVPLSIIKKESDKSYIFKYCASI